MVPGLAKSLETNSPAKFIAPPLAAGKGPLKRPLAGSIVGSGTLRLSSRRPRPDVPWLSEVPTNGSTVG